jgi:hypothetical protein
MKATCLLFLTLSWAMLMYGTGYAAPSQQTSAESSANENSVSPAGDRSHDTHAAEQAAPADEGKSQKETVPPEGQRLRPYASDKNHPRSRASLTAANRPKQLPTNSGKRSLAKNAANLRQPGSDRSGGAVNGGLIQNKTANNASPVRPASVVRPTVASLNPSLNNVRHRGPNPAVIGGSASSDSRNSGAIDGTRMNRKP